MKKVNFRPGYYNWLVDIDDNTYEVCGDIVAEYIDEDQRYKDTGVVSKDIIIDFVDYVLQPTYSEEKEKDMLDIEKLSQEEIIELQKQMIKVLSNRYCD